MTKVSELYDRDFFLWTQEQATALRAVKDSNLPLDWDNLAEAIESLGKSDRRPSRFSATGSPRHRAEVALRCCARPSAAVGRGHAHTGRPLLRECASRSVRAANPRTAPIRAPPRHAAPPRNPRRGAAQCSRRTI